MYDKKSNDIKFSIHFDGNCEVVSVTEPPPPEVAAKLVEATLVGDLPICLDDGLQVYFPDSPTILKARNSKLRICYAYIKIPGNGVFVVPYPC